MCRKRWLNRAVLRWDRKNWVPMSQQVWHDGRSLSAKRPWALSIGQNFAALHRWWWRLHISEKIIKRDVKPYIINQSKQYLIFVFTQQEANRPNWYRMKFTYIHVIQINFGTCWTGKTIINLQYLCYRSPYKTEIHYYIHWLNTK
jgi:hypothetical protein